ncbi:hypothetical protein JRI60_26940 [Archangium violaceum]|uniref:hypothetical protein n=1 Tax=Archangium violaceum TaxID=83451 RepID=UPI00194F74B2|nr:hypothetical protein [Archangium violaceum]QRN92849.1 hypothetical protein JRI60_26940 [Archangium violaceum]
MDSTGKQHRLALPELLEEPSESSTCWNCEQPWHPGPCGLGPEGPSPEAAPLDGLAEPAGAPARPAPPSISSPHVKKTFPLRLSASEREEGKRAASRMPSYRPGPWYGANRSWTEADWWRLVGVDWANHVNGLPAGVEPRLPSKEVKLLQVRIAELERAAPAHQARHPAVELEPTPAILAGDSFVAMCSGCGLFVCAHRPRALKACPTCGCEVWWEQTLPVGPFRAAQQSQGPAEKPAKPRRSSSRRAKR